MIFINLPNNYRTSPAVRALLPPPILSRDNLILTGAAEEDGSLYSVLAAESTNPSYIRILYIATAEGYRRKGIAAFLLNSFLENLKSNTILTYVTAFFFDNPAHEPIKHFFASQNNILLKREGKLFTIPHSVRLKSNRYQQILFRGQKVISRYRRFNELTKLEANRFLQEINAKSIPNNLLSADSLSDISLCRISGDKITAAALFSPDDDNTMEMVLLYGDRSNELSAIFSASCMLFEKKHLRTTLTFFAADDAAATFINRLFGEDIDSEQLISVHWNSLT